MDLYSKPNGLDALIEQIKAKVLGTVYDISTAKGRDGCRSDAANVAKSKMAIDRLGKALSAEYKEIPKKIDAERRRAFDELEALQKQVRQPLNGKKLRKADLQNTTQQLCGSVNGSNASTLIPKHYGR